MNAYTSSMANYNGTATSGPMGQDDGKNADSSKASAATMSLPTGGIRTAFHAGAQQNAPQAVAAAPAPKKYKQENLSAALPSPGTLAAQQTLPHPGASQLSNIVQNQQQQAPQQQALQQQQQQLMQQAVASQAAATGGHVSLPVGVGIRLGGIGGIAPATAQAAARAPGVPGQFNMWGQGTGGMSEQAIAERRQRNREHAKRSRVRKKFMLESLQEQVRQLQKENQGLRMLVQEHIPQHAMEIITQCCTSSPIFDDTGDEKAESQAEKDRKDADLVKSDFALMQSLATGQQCFVLSDPKLPDNPIVFASPGFYKLTGYTSKEVLGRNCRFLQGPATDAKAVDVIRKAVTTGSDATVCLLNYKADGNPFWNQFFIAALRDSDNCIVNYVSL